MKNKVEEIVKSETDKLMNKLAKWGCWDSLSGMEVSDIEKDIRRIAANALLEYQNTIYNATQDTYKTIVK